MMFNTTTASLLFATLVATVAFGHVIPEHEDRIGGGFRADRGQFPFIVSLRGISDNGTVPSHFCGGSILNERWILTAAHCMAFGINNTFIQVGAHHVLSDGVQHRPRRIIVHEDYDLEVIANDIALIELSEPIALNEYAQPIEVETEFIGAGEPATIAGWGRVVYQGALPEYLQYLPVNTLTNLDCDSRIPDTEGIPIIKENEICVYSARGSGACNGDSGGPAVLNGRLFGLASWTMPPCIDTGVPVVYVRLSEHLDWITANMQ